MNFEFSMSKMIDNNVVCLSERTKVTEAMESMHNAGVWSVIVTRRGQPEGVVTERDLLRKCFRPGEDPSEMELSDIMSYPLVTIEEDLPVGSVLKMLLMEEIRRLYVVNANGEIIGRVTQTGCLEETMNLIVGMQKIFEQM